ncbi:MAG: hypothetical protein C5B50_03315 [Verrucomicrobia bacterium]|nr:MAG: hypothetical protein C5B50_03315 [Verrucomicrobiota bacterium]
MQNPPQHVAVCRFIRASSKPAPYVSRFTFHVSRITFHVSRITIVLQILLLALSAQASPQTDNWLTTYSSRYARIYTNSAMQSAGTSQTTWNNGSQSQTTPAYCGIQEIYSSTNWVYVRSTGLASYIMGPWSVGFPNLPANQKTLYRFPLSWTVPTMKTSTGGGTIGIFVDGVAMFNSWDAFYWNGTTETSGAGTGYWNRDAYVNEGATFDPGYAHQQNTGTYHYHANPIALRYLLGDHVNYNATSKTYSEATNNPSKHSPLLAFVSDGFPLYGPYGYSSASNSASGIRRMVSGYVVRNGQYGTSNLTANGRTTIPQWAVRLYTNGTAYHSGPNVSTTYPLGRYMEDNDYLGDHGYTQGVDFDLDEYNGRWCVTPEYPTGIYAYFVAIAADGTPVFPYNIGRGYYGSPTGGTVTSIAQTVATNYLGNTNLVQSLNSPAVKNGSVTLTWSAIEGGSYRVDATSDFSGWTNVASGISPNQNVGSYTNVTELDHRFYRVVRTSVANFDSAGTTTFSGGGATSYAPGGSANRGTTVTVTITLPTTPPWPPANAPISSVTLAGSISGTGISDSTQGTVIATFTIPSNASTGAQSIVVVFNSGPTYTVSPFTIN